MNWTRGAFPKDTHNHGAVVLKPGDDQDKPRTTFFFCDFMGDHAVLVPTGQKVEADEVEQYLVFDLPEGVNGRANDDHTEKKAEAPRTLPEGK